MLIIAVLYAFLSHTQGWHSEEYNAIIIGLGLLSDIRDRVIINMERKQ